jgi:hypothetical protein
MSTISASEKSRLEFGSELKIADELQGQPDTVKKIREKKSRGSKHAFTLLRTARTHLLD